MTYGMASIAATVVIQIISAPRKAGGISCNKHIRLLQQTLNDILAKMNAERFNLLMWRSQYNEK